MKKLTSLQFFISKIQKKKISSALEEKLVQKLEEKTLMKNWRIVQLAQHTLSHSGQSQTQCAISLSVQLGLNVQSRSTHMSDLAWEGPWGKPKVHLARKCVLSTKSAWKVSYLMPIKGVGGRRKTHTESQSYPKIGPIL